MVLSNKTTLENLPTTYLSAINGLFNLTEKEIEALAHLVTEYSKLSKGIVDKGILNKVLFSADTRKEVALAIGIKPPALTSLIRQLTKKGALLKDDEGTLSVPSICIPVPAVTFKFIITKDGKKDDKRPTENRGNLENSSPKDGSVSGASGGDTQNRDEVSASISQDMLDDETPPED